MPVFNSTGSFNIGRDLTLVLSGGVGGPAANLQLDNVTGFMSKQVTKKPKVERLDGTILSGDIPAGWDGEFELDRGNHTLDDEFAAREQAFYAGGSLPTYALYQYIIETDGTTSVFQYTNVSLDFDAGSWKSDTTVKLKVKFSADRRQKV